MDINGKEVNFFYSVGARCEYEEYCINHPKASVTRAIINKAIIMNRAYNVANGITGGITEKELMALPNERFEELALAIDAQEKKDSGITVETEEIKSKNGKSADQ